MSRPNLLQKQAVWKATGFSPYPLQLPPLENCDSRVILVTGGERGGKALAIDTPILTTSGWKLMSDLVAGDFVFSEHGLPVQIKKVGNIQFGRPCYRVVFDDGNEIVADVEHEWLTESEIERKSRRRSVGIARINVESVKTTQEIAESVVARVIGKSQLSNHSISLALPLQYEHKQFEIDPYVLGAWLGDGTSRQAAITSADGEIIEEIEKRGVPVRYCGKYLYRLGITTYHNNTFTQSLRKLGVLSNKHIPEEYFCGSAQQRFELLQGLMDTDGYVSSNGRCLFDNTNPVLISGVERLLTTLGIKHRTRSKIARLYGKDCGTVYTISLTTNKKIFRLERKSQRQKQEIIDHLKRRYIVEVEQVDSVPVRCIEVDNTSGLYLAGEGLIPTHNSILVSRGEAVVWAVGFTDLIWIVGPDYEQARPEFEYIMNDLLQLGAVNQKEISFPKEGRCMLTTLTGCVVETKTSEEISKLAGRAPGLVVMTEVGQQDYNIFLKLRGRVAEKRGLLIMSGTLEEGSAWMVDLINQFKQPNPFDGRSYSVPSWANLAVYPGGREDPEIKHLEKILPEALFLERHAAVPRKASNVVFPEFDTVTHVSDLFEYIPELPVDLTIDPGFAGAYAVQACHVISGKIINFDEIYEHRPERGTDSMIEKAIKKDWWKDVRSITIDVAGTRAELTQGKSISSMWHQATKSEEFGRPDGIMPTGQYVPIQEGIDRYRAFLSTKQYGARLGFNPRCEGAIIEHSKYRYPRRRQTINRAESEKPVDAFNHAIKALTYLVVNKFGYWDGPPPVTKVEFAFGKPDPLREAMRQQLPAEFRD